MFPDPSSLQHPDPIAEAQYKLFQAFIGLLRSIEKVDMADPNIQKLLDAFQLFFNRAVALNNAAKKAISAGDTAKIKAATDQMTAALAALNVPGVEVPSVLTAAVAIGSVDIPVDTTDGWAAGEAVEFEGGVEEECELESVSPGMLRLKAPGTTAVHAAGETVR